MQDPVRTQIKNAFSRGYTRGSITRDQKSALETANITYVTRDNKLRFTYGDKHVFAEWSLSGEAARELASDLCRIINVK